MFRLRDSRNRRKISEDAILPDVPPAQHSTRLAGQRSSSDPGQYRARYGEEVFEAVDPRELEKHRQAVSTGNHRFSVQENTENEVEKLVGRQCGTRVYMSICIVVVIVDRHRGH
ncbi:hypothetical protein PG997_002814 [Apiospora hydei]|uniref:Uncharacterized protein n=1 Tax=Apiospora hydei TaxID=1337664 RepID=A0ABR1WXJ3_9PEZI